MMILSRRRGQTARVIHPSVFTGEYDGIRSRLRGRGSGRRRFHPFSEHHSVEWEKERSEKTVQKEEDSTGCEEDDRSVPKSRIWEKTQLRSRPTVSRAKRYFRRLQCTYFRVVVVCPSIGFRR